MKEILDGLIVDSAECQAERRKMIAALKQDALLLRFLKDKKIPAELIEKYPTRFQKLQEQLYRCKNCTGLFSCVEMEQGYAKTLRYEENRLTFVYTPCRYQNQKLKEQREDRKRNSHLRMYLLNDLPVTEREVFLEKIDLDKEKSLSYLKAVGELTAWQYGQEAKGYYLYGEVGVGKTYLAACLANKLAKEGRSVVFLHMPSYLGRLKNAFEHPEEYAYLSEIPKQADLLVLDDIGAEPVSAWYRDEVLLPLLNQRMNEKRLTCFTSNLSVADLEYRLRYSSKGEADELAAKRVIERVKVLSRPLEIKGQNRRHDG